MAKVPKEFVYVIMVRHLCGNIMNNETYILGVFSKKEKAMKEALKEEEWRGGKYRAMWFKGPLNEPVINHGRKYLLPKRPC